MTYAPRTLLAGGLVLVALAGALHLTLRLTFGERAAYINVRYAPTVDDATRAQIEKTYGLQPIEFREQRTWAYFLTDLSIDNVRGLVQNPAVEDTHHIDRRRFRLDGTGERGGYPAGRPAWVARLLEFFIRMALAVGAVALLTGAYRAWQERRARAAGSPSG
jgi:hypothetical protein